MWTYYKKQACSLQTGIQPEETNKVTTANVSTWKRLLLHKQQQHNGPSGYENICLWVYASDMVYNRSDVHISVLQ